MSDWWRVLKLRRPTVDPNVVQDAFNAVYVDPVEWGGDEAEAEKLKDAHAEGIGWCVSAAARDVRG